MNGFTLMGIGILIAIGVGIAYFAPKVISAIHSQPQRAQQHLDDVIAASPTGTTRVHEAHERSVLMIDGQPTPAAGNGLFLELKFYHGDKANKVHIGPDGKLREFTVVNMTSGDLLTEQPEGEDKSLKFYLYEDKTDAVPRGFATYLHGTEGAPGPAAKFAASNQTSDETIAVLGTTWSLMDIVWADLKIESGQVLTVNAAAPMPRLVMLLAQNVKDSTQWLLYIEPRANAGNLSPMLYVGRQFKPDVEVQA